jgi:isoleucyl-tRNA synthetase
LQDQILEELNIKEIEFIADDSALVSYLVKPNLAVLGAKYGKLLNEIREIIRQLPAADVAHKIEQGGTWEINLAERKIFLGAEELIIERQDTAGYSLIFDNGFTVALDTTITPELKKEGLVRDFIRHVQTIRKEADFQVEDRINVTAGSASVFFNEALTENLEYFKHETLAVNVEFNFTPGEVDRELNIDGNKISVSISRIQ